MTELASGRLPEEVETLLALSPNGEMLAVGVVQSAGFMKVRTSVRVYSTASWSVLYEVAVPSGLPRAAFSHDEGDVAILTRAQVQVLDSTDGSERRTLPLVAGVFDLVRDVVFLPGETGIVVAAGSKLHVLR